eukprot:CAMPEP_0180131154 /NCGR_PEP_ID=MMETSP0986-20121125/8260_1 /TAXON_ID=697907 /ORGANISM="non described non described, Strain CCMP2293" /LENGTH=533 /DNA_ID=CAMNT_0022070995 /DNA_START=51 /DNA_END=1652 /DNA_ORIENTATION=+
MAAALRLASRATLRRSLVLPRLLPPPALPTRSARPAAGIAVHFFPAALHASPRQLPRNAGCIPAGGKRAGCIPAGGKRAMSGAAHGATGKEAEVYDQLRNVIDPDFKQDIVSLGFIKQLVVSPEGEVSFDLELTTPACPVKEEFRTSCSDYLRTLSWVTAVKVNITSQTKVKQGRNQGCPGLKHTKRIIAVSSAKGGVGKSTIAVNLAYAISAYGGKVGIFDADIYGPSLPTMVAVDDPKVGLSKDNDAMLAPLEFEGVKLMSYGFTAKAMKGGAAAMRGPMVASTVHQLLAFTDWGELDYLIIDMPPGTGDIQLTIAQEVSLDGAVIVTTPQTLSFVDVIRGIDMFDSLSVPVVGLVENMGHFNCSCGKVHRPFGPGHARVLTEEYGTPAAVSLPIDQELSERGDAGRPLVLGGSKEVTQIFMELAAAVIQQVSVAAATSGALPLVEHQAATNEVVIRPVSGDPTAWKAFALRKQCRCAVCTDDNKPPPTVAEGVSVIDIIPKGRYAIEIHWDDGHKSLLPYSALLRSESIP